MQMQQMQAMQVMQIMQMQQVQGHLQIPSKLSISHINAYTNGSAPNAFSPTAAGSIPPPPVDTPGCVRPKSYDDAMLNPNTPWGSRMRPHERGSVEQSCGSASCYAEQLDAAAGAMGVGMHAHHHALTQHTGGGKMAGRMMAQQMAMTPEQQRVRLVTGLVMQRLCVWGEYRTVCDWPSELVQLGAMPCIQEALLTSPIHSLTIPQMVTAVKERTGNTNGGKALDMLNLKVHLLPLPTPAHPPLATLLRGPI